MKILFISGREPTYVRNAMILKCLKRNGVEIIDCTDSSSSYPARYMKNLTGKLNNMIDNVAVIREALFRATLFSWEHLPVPPLSEFCQEPKKDTVDTLFFQRAGNDFFTLSNDFRDFNLVIQRSRPQPQCWCFMELAYV
jgi:hypothetical protein